MTEHRKRVNDPQVRLIGANIRRYRRAQGVTLVEFARALGIEAQTLTLIEQGLIAISAAQLFRAAQLLEVPIAQFGDVDGNNA